MSTTTGDLHLPFHAMEDALRDIVFERTEEIHTAMLALIGRQHHFVLGSPGIAKSLMVDEMLKRMAGVPKFKLLLTRYTQPDEVFGGPDVKQLAETGVFERRIEGMLPTSVICFLDEVFKANSAILNALLMAINERRFNLGTKVIEIPLHTVFAASNELAESDELAALWDRLHFRHFAQPLQEKGNFVKMISSMEQDEDPEPLISLDQLRGARRLSSRVELLDEVFDATIALKADLAEKGVEVSDRRWREAMKAVRSEAFFNGRMKAEIADMRPLMHFLWSNPDHIRVVRQAVLELANPLEREAAELLDNLNAAYETYQASIKDAENKQQEAAHSVEMYRKLTKAKDAYTGIRERHNKTGRRSDIINELGDRVQSIGRALLAVISQEGGTDS